VASELSVQQIIDVVRGLASSPGYAIEADTPLLSTGIIDSLSMAELLERLHEISGTTVDIEAMGVDNADTPAQMLELIAR
jgi:hypothetical protein